MTCYSQLWRPPGGSTDAPIRICTRVYGARGGGKAGSRLHRRRGNAAASAEGGGGPRGMARTGPRASEARIAYARPRSRSPGPAMSADTPGGQCPWTVGLRPVHEVRVAARAPGSAAHAHGARSAGRPSTSKDLDGRVDLDWRSSPGIVVYAPGTRNPSKPKFIRNPPIAERGLTVRSSSWAGHRNGPSSGFGDSQGLR